MTDYQPTNVLDNGAIKVNVYDEDGNLLRTEYQMVDGGGNVGTFTPLNKDTLDRYLAAEGETAGTSTVYTLAYDNFQLLDGALVRIKLHVDSGATPTLNVNGTGAKAMMETDYKPMSVGKVAGTWINLIYSDTFDFFMLQGSNSLSWDYRGTYGNSKMFEIVRGIAPAYANSKF